VISVARVCGRCGAKISSDSTGGGCPACLLASGLDLPDTNYTNPHEVRKAQVGKALSDFGDYELLEEVGRGGQGVVYRAHQKSLNRTVALKVVGLGPWATEIHLKRFRREAEAAASLNHPCIVPIYEVGERDGACYFSMGLVEGEQLDAIIKRGTMPIRRAVELIARVARTVDYAHQHGILHRDIKPGNILLDKNGEPHLTDFGLARLVEPDNTITATLEVLGTPSYMAPEQATGNNTKLTKATDVYGLGAVLYQLLTGHPPFAGGTTYETIKLLLETEPRQPRLLNPKIDRELSTICLKCLEKDPQRRYSSALALAEDLEHWLKHEPIRAKPSGVFVHGRKWVRRKPAIAALIASLVALAAAIVWNVWQNTRFLSGPEKSVAVLPFENLSRDPENAYFADGVQDEILNHLTRIADLKVIGRTSVMQYKSGIARDLRNIGYQLGIANVAEGSVQRSGNRVRVSVRLVDVRTDRQLWGQTYDRDIADVFVIQSDIAMAIADQLHARLSPSEKSEIERPLTSDIVALNLYTRAENLILTSFSSVAKVKLLEAADLLNQAVARDPSFFQAYCRLAYTHDRLYFQGFDHTPARVATAEAAIEAASRLRPDADELHLARAENLYQAHLDYNGALAELELARVHLPNHPRLLELIGYIERRRGNWEESTRNLERSNDLDPRNFFLLQQLALSYGMLHRYADQTPVVERALSVEPNDVDTRVELAAVDFHSKADTKPLHQTVDSIQVTNPAALPNVANDWLSCALAERDLVAAKNALDAFGDTPLTDYVVHWNRPLMEGVIARMANDDEKARRLFSAARAEQEKVVQAQPDYGPALCVLGLIDAALGRKEEALREGRRAVELVPAEKEAMSAPLMVEYLAMIAAWVGDKDLACQQLAVAVRPPSTVSYGQLKLLPHWDALRGDPRFEYIVASLAPTGTTQSAPEKSIAVLPLENLSNDPDNAYFAEGIQEEILTRLANIGDLRVISRTSTQRYQSKPVNLSEIAKQLGVANILEGSVQKAADQVRVNVQLINAQTDSHLWAQTYDRKLTNIFGIESEIAKGIAESLQAKLTGREEQALALKATNNPEAYDAYLRGLSSEARSMSAWEAADFYDRAVQLDPNFALAWARLSRADADLYLDLRDASPRRRDAAKRALETAQKLQPDSPETLLALGYYQYRVLRDDGVAKTTFGRVGKMLPARSEVPYALAEVARHEGQWDQSIAYYEQALALDPRNVELLREAAFTYSIVRQFEAALKLYDRALDITPNDPELMAGKASIYQAHGNLQEAAKLLSEVNWQTPLEEVRWSKINELRLERNYEAVRLLQARLGQFHFDSEFQKVGIQTELAFTQRLAGDTAGARATAEQARNTLEQLYRDQPDNAWFATALSRAYAALDQKDSALKMAEQAIVLARSAKNPVAGPFFEENLAGIQTILGETSRPISTLARLLQTSGMSGCRTPLTPALLRLDPTWDPLRKDPAFQKLCEQKQPRATP